MAETNALSREVIRRLKAAGKRRRRNADNTYCPTAATMLGLSAEELDPIIREAKHQLKGEPAANVFDFVRELVDTGIFEARAVAWLALAAHKAAMAEIGEKQIVECAQGIDNWAATDTYGVWVAGPAWREGRIGTKLINRWIASDDPWFRRLAVVCTVALNVKARGGTGDPRRTFAVCRRVVDDKHPMVAKGLSWALRAVVQHDRTGVDDFLGRYADRLPAIVRREVRNKLDTGLKTPRKKDRK